MHLKKKMYISKEGIHLQDKIFHDSTKIPFTCYQVKGIYKVILIIISEKNKNVKLCYSSRIDHWLFNRYTLYYKLHFFIGKDLQHENNR